MKKFLLILSILLLTLFTYGCQNQAVETSLPQTPAPTQQPTRWDDIVQKNELKVGVFTLEDTFDNQLIDAFSKEANLAVTKVLLSKDTPIEQQINDGSVDMIWGQIPATSQSSTMFRLSNPYFHSTVLYLSASENLVPEASTPVGVLKNSAEEFIANGFFDTVKVYPSENELFQSLSYGTVKCVLYNQALFENRQQKQGAFHIVKELPYDLVIAFEHNNTAVSEEVEKIIAKIKADGTATEICSHWYPKDLIVK